MVAHKSTYLAHIRITNFQYNLPSFKTTTLDAVKRIPEIVEHFEDPLVKENVNADLSIIHHLKSEIKRLEAKILKLARTENATGLNILQTLPGAGKVLPLTLLYEIGDIKRFPTVQQFCSYSRLVKCKKESDGKIYGTQGAKIGNHYLKWAFSELIPHARTVSPKIDKFLERKISKHNKGKAYSILSHKLGRATYFMLKRKEVFDIDRLFK